MSIVRMACFCRCLVIVLKKIAGFMALAPINKPDPMLHAPEDFEIPISFAGH